ncbi:MAG: YbaB/EbfC family nucleoid-associated protein [Phycisphaerae bacterium]|nr:YbaB/EbfC family nucleoid-associated protein [Phycisphaerae bacterium]
MFGQLGQLASILKNSGKIEAGMKEAQQRLAAARFVGEAGAGQVRATVDGKGEMVGIKIEPALAQSNDIEMLEDLITAAVRDAVARSRVGMQHEMSALGNSLGISGLDQMIEKFK